MYPPNFTLDMPDFLQAQYVPRPRMRNWLEGSGVALPDAQPDPAAAAGQLQSLQDQFRQGGGFAQMLNHARNNPAVALPADNIGGPWMRNWLEGSGVALPDNPDASPWGGMFAAARKPGLMAPSEGMRPWMPDPTPNNSDPDGLYLNTKAYKPPVNAVGGPYPQKPGWGDERVPASKLPLVPIPSKPTDPNPGQLEQGKPTEFNPALRMRGAARFADGGRVDLPDYLMGAGSGKVAPAGASGTPAGAVFSAPPSKMAPLSAVAPGGGELNIQTAAPVVTAPAAANNPETPAGPQEIILPKLGRSRQSLSPSIRGYTPGGDTYGVAKLRTTRDIMPKFADGGRVPSLANPVQMMIGEGVMDEEEPYSMFSGEDPEEGIEDEDRDSAGEMKGCEGDEEDGEGYKCGGRVKGYADGGRVNANNYISTLLNGRNPFGRIGANIQNVLADNAQAQYRGFDPRLIQAGFAVRPDTMAENANTFITNWTNPNWQDGMRMIDGVGHVQFGDFVRQLEGGGQGINQDDLMKYVRDPSKVIYDEEAGLITPRDNFTFQPEDGLVTKFMHSAIPAIAMAAAGAGINNAFFGGPDLGSIIGTGTSGAGGGAGMGGGAGGAAGPSLPPLEGAPALGGGGASAASTAASNVLPQLSQLGLQASNGALIPGMTAEQAAAYLGSTGALGSGGGATGAFDTAGWDGTGISGNTGTLAGGPVPSGGAAGDAAGTFDQTGWQGTNINGNTGVTDQSWVSRLGNVISNNPTQAARIAAAIAGGLGGGGGGNSNSTYTPTTDTGTGTTGPAGPAATKPWEDYLKQFGSTQVSMSGMSGGGDVNISAPSNGYYDQAYRPLEDAVLKSARERMDPSFREAKAQEAVADVANAFEAQRGALARDASRRGMRAPMARDMIGMAASEGAARALAANKARRDMEESAISQGAGLVSQGQRYIDRDAQAAAAAAGASGAVRAAGINAEASRANAADNRAWQAYLQDKADANRRYEFDTTNATNREAIARGQFNVDRSFNQQQNQIDANNRQRNLTGLGTIISGGLSLLKGFESGGRVIDGHAERVPDADEGGRVRGPGHETSDSIPAKLSKNEMVLNTDAVKLIDSKAPGLLDRINHLGLMKRAMSMGAGQPIPTVGVRG